MTLVSSIVIGIVLLLGLANGLRRGGLKEGTALIGVLLGALLVEFWARRWGETLSQRSGLKLNTAILLLSLTLLIGTALFSGYGSGLFFRRTAMKSGERIGGAVLGLLNMGLLVSFALRYTQQLYFEEASPAQPVLSWIRTGVVSRYMLNWQGQVLLGAAIGLGVISLLTAALRLGRLASTAGKPAKPPIKAPASPAPRPTQPTPASPAGAFGSDRPTDVLGGASQGPPRQPAGQQESFLDRQTPRTGP